MKLIFKLRYCQINRRRIIGNNRYRNRIEVFCKKGVFRNFAKFTGKHVCQSLFFSKVAGTGTLAQVFSCEFCEISKNTFLYRTPADIKFYVPVVTLLTQDNTKLLQQLKSIFKRTIYWYRFQPKNPAKAQNQYLHFLIDPSF